MLQFGGKPKKTSSESKRHFTVVMGNKEHGLYVSSTPSSAARKAVTKLCTANKSKKVEFYIREITQGSKKKTYGPYEGYIEKLKEPIELKGRVIKYKPVAKLSGKSGSKKGGQRGGGARYIIVRCQNVGSGNKLVNAEDICKEGKEYIEKYYPTKDFFESIEDLDGGKSFQINIKPEKERYDRIIKVTLDEFFNKFNDIYLSKKAAAVNIYKINNVNGLVNTWNGIKFEWEKR